MPCSPTPIASWCWCAARSLPRVGRRRCAPTPACARCSWGLRPSCPTRRCRRAEAVMNEPQILVIEGLNAAYGLAQILFDLSLSVRRGEVVALMGRNGAGKSSTLKAIMGLLAAEARVLRFAGHDIRGSASYRIARLGLGYVPEERRIFTDLTVAENLAVGARPAVGGKAPAWTPERLYSIFPNLAHMRDRRASQMSGGEQQMLTIARTLMGNPQAVLLDEPSEGLAPVVQAMAT